MEILKLLPGDYCPERDKEPGKFKIQLGNYVIECDASRYTEERNTNIKEGSIVSHLRHGVGVVTSVIGTVIANPFPAFTRKLYVRNFRIAFFNHFKRRDVYNDSLYCEKITGIDVNDKSLKNLVAPNVFFQENGFYWFGVPGFLFYFDIDYIQSPYCRLTDDYLTNNKQFWQCCTDSDIEDLTEIAINYCKNNKVPAIDCPIYPYLPEPNRKILIYQTK